MDNRITGIKSQPKKKDGAEKKPVTSWKELKKELTEEEVEPKKEVVEVKSKKNKLPPLPKEPLQSIPNSTAFVRSILFNPGAIGGRLGVTVLESGLIVEVNRRSKLNVRVGWQIF